MTLRLAPRALVVVTAAALLALPAGAPPTAAQQPTAQTVAGMRTLYDVRCAPDGTCLGVGSTLESRGAVVVLRANGQHGPVRQLFGTGALNAITCPPSGNCIAVGAG